jgi:hypothetical protein
MSLVALRIARMIPFEPRSVLSLQSCSLYLIQFGVYHCCAKLYELMFRVGMQN